MAKIHSVHTTKLGTKLDLLDLRGKPYLQVAHRLVWFTEENENYNIVTSFLHLDQDGGCSVCKAIITIFDKEGKITRQAQATKSETRKNFADFIEKSETGAIGRALAMLGYGTQFTGDELDEGERLADAPISQAKKVSSASNDNTTSQETTSTDKPKMKSNSSFKTRSKLEF